MEENENEDSLSLLEKLQVISKEIKISFTRDCDRTEYMKALIEIIKDILTKEKIEDYFSGQKEAFDYFIDDFLKSSLQMLSYQDKIYGENGDDIVLELYLLIFKLFLKFHKNNEYTVLFERIRETFNNKSRFFNNHKFEDGKKHNLTEFNMEYCSEMQKEIKKFNVGDEIDIPYIQHDIRYEFLKKLFVRGRIVDIVSDQYEILCFDNSKGTLPISDPNIFPKGTKTSDWDWRQNLKKYDVIDCFDRSRWYPATILDVKEEEENGFKNVIYRVAFRLYVDHFKNPNDENDTYENHIEIWKTYNKIEITEDNENEKYVGEGDNCSEDIFFYSKRIQKFGTYSVIQQKYLDFIYTPNRISDENNELKKLNDELEGDISASLEDNFFYEKDGKKNYILGKNEKEFEYMFAKYLKLIEKDNGYEKLLDILKDNPSIDEIYNVYFYLYKCLPYLHKEFYIQNSELIKTVCINYINNLDEKNMRKLPKELNELVSNLIYQINLLINKNKDKEKNDDLDIYDEMTLAFAMKSLKTSIFDFRLKGIKDLNDIIEKIKDSKITLDKLTSLIKENKILNEIFGANYHSQLISRSNEIIKLLLQENALDENDMTLIWSCTKRGDLEAKLTILKLLSSIAENLQEKHIEMLLNSVLSNVDKKISNEEIEFVFKLSTQNKDNETNMNHCCEYLCQCYLMSNPKSTDVEINKILEKIILVTSQDDKYLKKVLNICENCLTKNDKTIPCFTIIERILEQYNTKKDEQEQKKENVVINEFTKDNHLINLFENNLKMYLTKTKEILEQNKISFTEGDLISKYIIDDYSHSDNIKKRLDILLFLIKEYYPNYDFLPFLKNVLVINPVGPNDQIILYDFIKKYISDNSYTNNTNDEIKEKFRQEVLELISENDKNEITLEQLKLFIAMFFDMNKEKIKLEENKENEIKEVINIEELTGLDKLWNIILQINNEKILSFGINILYQIYKNDNIDKLFEKCNTFIKNEKTDTNDETLIEKYLTLMKLIIIESEKNILFKPKSHLSLLKNCFINLPIEFTGKDAKDIKTKEDTEKFIFCGNTNFNDLKIIISKIYEIPTDIPKFSYSKKYLNYLKKNNLIEQEKEELIIDENYNNESIYNLFICKDKDSNLLPKEKIIFSIKKPEEEKLVINGEMNPKLKKIIKEWFYQFTEGTMKMDEEGVARFISGVTPKRGVVKTSDGRIKNFMKEEDKDKKGYVTEEEFINFFDKAIKHPAKIKTVKSNLEQMNIGPDLKKIKEKCVDINFYENEKLPRYKLGNDLNYVESLFKKYYDNPDKNIKLVDFLSYLTTNQQIYNNVLENLFSDDKEKNEENNECFIIKAFNEKNKYLELNYIFIIIESILQDLEIYLYNNKYIDSNDFIILGYGNYKLVSLSNEPFDEIGNIHKKVNFIKNLLKPENLQKIINHVNDLLDNLIKVNKEKSSSNLNSKLNDFCLRGIKLLNILNNFCTINDEKITSKQNIKQNGVYYLGLINLSQLFENEDHFKIEFDNIIYKDLTNNLINILTKTPTEEDKIKEIDTNYFKKECFDLLLKILSSNKQLLENYKAENDSKKDEIIKLFNEKFMENESKTKDIFIKNISNSIEIAENNQNKNYLEFLSKIVNNLLDKLINPGNTIEEETKNEKNQFTPDNSFFELYNQLHKLNSDSNNNKSINNESSLKIYELIMKSISNSNYKTKIFLSLLQLLNLHISNNEELKSQILLSEQKDGKSLYQFLFEQAMPELISNKDKKKEEDKDKELLKKTRVKDIPENKFIPIEDIKEEKKDDNEDNNLNEELNQISNEFLLNCFTNTNNPKIIGKLLKIIYFQRKLGKKNKQNENNDDDYNSNLQINNNYISKATSSFTQKKYGHVGLKNLGCICYMNSIMQQMYMVPTFRYAIMSADDHKESQPSRFHEVDDDNLLHQLQIMYTYLTFSNKSDFAPRDFCYSYKDIDGKPTNVRAQQDSQEFYNNFCDKIENCLKETKYKYIVGDVFVGQTCSSVECSNCKNISNRFEDFYNMTLEVKNMSNLNDSLQKMIVPEIIDDFKCSNCNQKVRISKITSLNKLPNVLVVHLKRFYLNYEIFKTMKINSKFEFPKTLNLKQFCVCEIQKNSTNKNDEIYIHEEDYYEYDLKGINVHTGSADGGHYFSFIDVNRDGKNNLFNTYKKENWLQFNDSKVLEFDTNTIPSECYGGNYEGSSYEKCQNAYLLIYERKKKTPIRVLYEKDEIEKLKTNIDENTDLIKFNKDNKSEINKKYDLSRLNNTDIKEEDLYKKIFFNEEKNEYYKYIPFYNIPKYAPSQVYNKIKEENNEKKDEEESDNNNTNINREKYEQILSNLINESKFDINNNNYDDQMKEGALVCLLEELFKSMKSTQEYIGGEEGYTEFNNMLNLIFTLIKNVINKDTNDELLETLYNYFKNEIFLKFCFTSKYKDNNEFLGEITNEENAKLIMDILFEFIKIQIEKNKKITKLYHNILRVIKESNNKDYRMFWNNNQQNDNYQYTVIYLYQLLDKISYINKENMEYFSDKKIIKILCEKIAVENEEIRKIIYKILKYFIKNTTSYTKELFDFDENEKEGENIILETDEIQEVLKEEDDTVKNLIKEDFELFIIFTVIASNDDIKFLRDFFFKGITQLDKIDYIIKILYSLSIINDKYVLDRLQYILGYPSPIIREIPREKNNDTPPSTQKWPLFGAKLINGNIDTQIYEFVNINKRNKNLCLLRLLLPNENDKKNEFIVPKDTVKKIIIKLIDNCLGEKNNYSLFKYLYLNPARSLRYENLFEEMKQIVLNGEKDYDFGKYSEKEKEFIKQIQKEVDKALKYIKDENSDDDDSDNEGDENPPPVGNQIYFTCNDNNMKIFIGYNCNIIPGDIVREEIVQIATGGTLAMYRLEYYTKYFDRKELRDKLLKEEKNKENIDEAKDKEKMNTNVVTNEENKKENKIQEDINKKEEEEDKKGKEMEMKDIKEEEKKVEEKKEEEKKVEEKKGQAKKEEEKKGEAKKEEEKKEEEKKDEEKKEEEKKEEEKKDEEKKEEEKVKEKVEEKVYKKKEEEKKDEEKKEEEKKEEEKKEEEVSHTKEEEDIPTKEIESKKKPSEVQKEEELEEPHKEPLETEIDNSLEEENRRIDIRKYDISSSTEEKIIYGVLPKKESIVILEDNNIKDKNKVKRVLFRYIFTNTAEEKKDFRATVFSKIPEHSVQKFNSCLMTRFIFDRINGEDMTNFYNLMRIRGELPFIERDNVAISVDLTDEISFYKK